MRFYKIAVLLICYGTIMAQQPSYKNSHLPIEERIHNLLSIMTIDEKIDQLNMKSLNVLELNDKGKVSDNSLIELFKGHSIGCLESPFVEHSKVATLSEAADHYLRTKTRLGIPAIQLAECLHGEMALGTTIFPQAIGLGSTWNPALIKQMSSIIAEEASAAGVDQALSPLFDIARDPRYGRVEECYGEDPFLVKEMGVAFIKGMQGEPNETLTHISENKIACTAKHFAAYSAPEAGINIAPALVGERTLRELYFYPFEAAVKEANIYSFMPGYHEIDGIPAHENRWLLTNVLRKEWGFNGYVISDYGAIGMLNNFHMTAKDKSESAYQAITAGVDLEAPSQYAYGELKDLIEKGKLSETILDSAVANVLRVKFKLGLFDRPYHKPNNLPYQIHKDKSISLAQQIAEESIVLLKNEDAILPINKQKIKSIAVIGPNANKVQFGDYSITKNNDYGITVLEGIRKYINHDLTINYAEGCGITDLSEKGFDEAVKLAKNSDIVVLVLGGTSVIYSGIGWGDSNSKEINTCGEGYDRNELNFPGVQSKLLDLITSQGKPVIVIMLNGRPYTIENEIDKASAILEAWYPGEKGGDAIARILFGEVNPSGKLSISFPKTTGHIPVYANYKPSGRGYYHQSGTPQIPGRDYVFSSPAPLFCLGFGLSYTTFNYNNLVVNNTFSKGGNTIDVSFDICNTGKHDGADVAQLYVRDVVSSVTTPVKSLKAFKKVYLKQGETQKVSLQIKKEDLMLWNKQMKRELEPGEFKLYIGESAEDVKLEGNFEVL